ncbi:pirin family protein [Xylanibacillus composti]|uniref:Pirin family protein n=1 Tax=Xylanibacillus composti TaxID=1572762 RepID=A0A8J4M1F8_9BACL|nr:pirin family protein [Xylanibacillus composti]MDT9726035.1 pirin family protein [Xylanibacillus composti]GIQ68820.1 hypothetical protein XYCOK13_16440 [Xylanibacillus composti]
MVKVYPSASRQVVDLGWLRSRPSFSFGQYFDPDNTAFSVMRVCNHDEISGGRGFGPHPHSDMEVVTIVLSGQIKHEDNLGNAVVTPAGGVQRMTAGTGIVHAEYNASETEELSLLQLWFMPRERGLAPSFESKHYDPDKLTNALLPVVSSEGSEQVAMIHQDMTIYLSRLEPGKRLGFKQAPGRSAYLYVMEGQLLVNGTGLAEGDTARITDTPALELEASGPSFLMLIDLP